MGLEAFGSRHHPWWRSLTATAMMTAGALVSACGEDPPLVSLVTLIDPAGIVSEAVIYPAEFEDLPPDWQEASPDTPPPEERYTVLEARAEGSLVRVGYYTTTCEQRPIVEVRASEISLQVSIDRGVWPANCGATANPWFLDLTLLAPLGDRGVELEVFGGTSETFP